MKFIFFLVSIILVSVGSMSYWSIKFDYVKRDSSLQKISLNKIYIVPSLRFKSRGYREFVYEK